MFFESLVASGMDRFFHPHPFTREEAIRRANYRGKDLYYVLTQSGEIVGYGMLRGWDEGFQVPSLGIAIGPRFQGRGLGRLLMHFLHSAAIERGAEKIRLKVHVENGRAKSFYQSLGYEFDSATAGESVGFIDLSLCLSVSAQTSAVNGSRAS